MDTKTLKEIAVKAGFKEKRNNKGLFLVSLKNTETGLNNEEGVDVYIDFRKGSEYVYAFFWHNKGAIEREDLEKIPILQAYVNLKDQVENDPGALQTLPEPSEPTIETPNVEDIGAILTFNLTGEWVKIKVSQEDMDVINAQTFAENVEKIRLCLVAANALYQNDKHIMPPDTIINVACALFKSCMKHEHYALESEILKREYIKRYGEKE